MLALHASERPSWKLDLLLVRQTAVAWPASMQLNMQQQLRTMSRVDGASAAQPRHSPLAHSSYACMLVKDESVALSVAQMQAVLMQHLCHIQMTVLHPALCACGCMLASLQTARHLHLIPTFTDWFKFAQHACRLHFFSFSAYNKPLRRR
jgi:hypothetical protein